MSYNFTSQNDTLASQDFANQDSYKDDSFVSRVSCDLSIEAFEIPSKLVSVENSQESLQLNQATKHSKEINDAINGLHFYHPSMLVKSGKQDYYGITGLVYISSEESKSNEGSVHLSFSMDSEHNKDTFINVPQSGESGNYSGPTVRNGLSGKESNKIIRASTIYTSLSSDSSKIFTSLNADQSFIVSKKILERISSEPEEEGSEIRKREVIGYDRSVRSSIRKSTLAFPNLLFCPTCKADTYTEISFKIQELGFFESIKFFFQAIKCCGEPNSLSRYQEVVHTCRKCKKILARVRFS